MYDIYSAQSPEVPAILMLRPLPYMFFVIPVTYAEKIALGATLNNGTKRIFAAVYINIYIYIPLNKKFGNY